MIRNHSFVVPYQHCLVVDLETIMSYCHIIIFQYHECISCDSQRTTVEGIQQHMDAKGHCRFDLTEDTAEFYETGSSAYNSVFQLVGPDGKSLRLPSGKLLSHRTEGSTTTMPRVQSKTLDRPSMQPRTQTRVSSRTTNTDSEVATVSEESIPTASTELSRLTVSDQQNLAHLPRNEVRSLIAIGVKHKDQARRAEARAKSKLERAANTNLFGFYRPDGPDRIKRGWSGGG